MLPVGGVKKKVVAAHRCGLAHVILPRQNRKQFEVELGEDLQDAVATDYATRIDKVLDLALPHAPPADDVAAAVTAAGRASLAVSEASARRCRGRAPSG